MDGLGSQMIKRKRQMFSEREYSSCFPENGPVSSSGHKWQLFPFIPGPSGRCPFGWPHTGTAPAAPGAVGQTLNSLHLGGQSLFFHILGFGEDLLAHPASIPAGCPGSCGCPRGWWHVLVCSDASGCCCASVWLLVCPSQILALCHIAVGQQMNLHWLHKVINYGIS